MIIKVKLSDGKIYDGIVRDNTEGHSFNVLDRNGKVIKNTIGYKSVEIATDDGKITFGISLDHYNQAMKGAVLNRLYGGIFIEEIIPEPVLRYKIHSIIVTGDSFGDVEVRYSDISTGEMGTHNFQTFGRVLEDELNQYFGKGCWKDFRQSIKWKMTATRFYSVTVNEEIEAASYEEAEQKMKTMLSNTDFSGRLQYDHDNMKYDHLFFNEEIGRVSKDVRKESACN